MKAVILAGGLGTRLSEETDKVPKPMVDIGGKPMLWHIMNIFSAGGINDFCIASGYKSEVIKEYFYNFHFHHSDLSVDMRRNKTTYKNKRSPAWVVDIIDTGEKTMTGGRLKRLKPLLNNETFMMTYGDGVADIDVRQVLKFHKNHGKKATITAVRPPARFGGLEFDGDKIISFREKPQVGEGWINGGFMVLDPGVFEYIYGDETIFEASPLEKLCEDGELMAYKHEGFWQPMDTLREKQLIEDLWQSENAPWKIWS